MPHPDWQPWLEAMVRDVKLFLRKSTDAFDDEIAMLIMAALEDMEGAGVGAAAGRAMMPEAGIIEAVKLYAKANFGFPEDSEKWQIRYEKLRDSLALHKFQGHLLTEVMPKKGPPHYG